MNIKKLSKIFAIFLCLASLISCANVFSKETQTLPEDGYYQLIKANGDNITGDNTVKQLKNGVLNGNIKLKNDGTCYFKNNSKGGTWKLIDNILYIVSDDEKNSFEFKKVSAPSTSSELPVDGPYQLQDDNGTDVSENGLIFIIKNGILDGTIQFKKDGTFCIKESSQTGKWSLNDNFLILVSDDGQFSYVFFKLSTPPTPSTPSGLPENGNYQLIENKGANVSEDNIIFQIQNGILDGIVVLKNDGTFYQKETNATGKWTLTNNILNLVSDNGHFSYVFLKLSTSPSL